MRKVELVFIPSPYIGHLLSRVSTIEFAKLVVKNNQHISILAIIFEMSIHLAAIEAYIESQSRELDPNRFTFLTLPPLSNPPESSSAASFYTIVNLQNPLIKQAIRDRPTKLVAFVLDWLCVTMIDIANELGVPSYVYLITGASLLNLMFHFQALVNHDHNGVDHDLATHLSSLDADDELDLPRFENLVPVKVLPYWFMDKESVWSTSIHHL